MKRFFKPALSVLLLLGLIGCGGGQAGEKVHTVRIGVSLYRQEDTFISLMANYMQEAAKELEQEKNIKIILTFSDAQSSQNKQNDHVSAFLEKNYDAVMVNLVDRTAAAALIDKAKAADVPMIFFNREPVEEDLSRWSKVCYIGADAAESGQLQGSLLVDLWQQNPQQLDRDGDGKVQYVMLEGDAGHQDSLIRTEAVIKTLTDAGIKTDKLATGIANWMRVQASTKMALWIEKYGDQIEAVIANNDDMALGALDALETAGTRTLPVVVGIDGTPVGLAAVADRRMLGTVYNDAEGQARAAVRVTCAMIEGESVESLHMDGNYLRLPYIRITRDNVRQYQTDT